MCLAKIYGNTLATTSLKIYSCANLCFVRCQPHCLLNFIVLMPLLNVHELSNSKPPLW